MPGMEGEMEGHTGSAVVFVLVILLWLYASYRLWVVWEYKLNFEQVMTILMTVTMLFIMLFQAGPKGWDYLVHWTQQKTRWGNNNNNNNNNIDRKQTIFKTNNKNIHHVDHLPRVNGHVVNRDITKDEVDRDTTKDEVYPDVIMEEEELTDCDSVIDIELFDYNKFIASVLNTNTHTEERRKQNSSSNTTNTNIITTTSNTISNTTSSITSTSRINSSRSQVPVILSQNQECQDIVQITEV